MKKIEFIWREILYQSIEKRETKFQQQMLAKRFHISSSTVNGALEPLRKLGAIRVGGRGFTVVDYEKILYHWANHRNVSADIVVSLCVNLPVREIEGLLPRGTIPTAFTAVRERVSEAPAQYDTVYCYSSESDLVRTRFSGHQRDGIPNLILLSADPFLPTYGGTVPLAQLFVDLWNCTQWFAKEFTNTIKHEIDGLLS